MLVRDAWCVPTGVLAVVTSACAVAAPRKMTAGAAARAKPAARRWVRFMSTPLCEKAFQVLVRYVPVLN